MSKTGRNEPCPCGSGKKYKKYHGGPERVTLPLPRERIHTAIIDKDKNLAVWVSNDILFNTLIRDIPKVAESFDALCKEDFQFLNDLVCQTTGIFAQVAGEDLNEFFETCRFLILNGMNSFYGAVHLWRSGFRLQPASHVRSVLETVSTVCHLIQKPEDLEKLLKKKFDSTSSKSMESAKKLFPMFGRIWGSLSNQFVHIGRGNLHRSRNPGVVYAEMDDALQVNLRMLKLSIWALFVVTELAFITFVQNPRYWKRVDLGSRLN